MKKIGSKKVKASRKQGKRGRKSRQSARVFNEKILSQIKVN
jgi:hypothetical protein